MKLLSSTKIFGLTFVLTTILLVLDVSLFSAGAFGQENNNNRKYDIVILDHAYLSKFFADELVGEILNNGTATIKAVRITASFYDDQDEILGTEYSGTTPFTINPTNTAAFTIKISDESIKSNATSYDFTAKWKDEYLSSNYFTRLIGGEISADNSGGGEDDDDDDDDD